VTGSGHVRSIWGPALRRAGPLLLWTALLALAPPSASAADRSVELAASTGLRHVRYEEWGPYGDLLDSEDGWIPTVGARAQVRIWRVVGELSGRLARGDLAYHGLAQLGFGSAHVRSTSAARFLDGRVRAGMVVDPWNRLTLLVGGASRRWDRDIHATTLTSSGSAIPVRGLSEVYSWYELEAAIRAALVATPRLTWLAEVRVLRTRSPRLRVDWNGTKVGLDLGPWTGSGTETEVQVTLRPGLFLAAGAAVERFSFGESAAATVGRVSLHEPDSDTWGVRVEVGIGARL
jgi:hypothetical protein